MHCSNRIYSVCSKQGVVAHDSDKGRSPTHDLPDPSRYPNPEHRTHNYQARVKYLRQPPTQMWSWDYYLTSIIVDKLDELKTCCT